jgi:hypothetical protein
MKEQSVIRLSILVFWTFFWGLSVMDKIIPDVHFLWVGKDFFALFVKFFGSLGLKDSLFATVALAGVSSLEAINFSLYVVALYNFIKGESLNADKWLFRGILSSVSLFALFSIADQVFGDRFQLLEHGLFWLVLVASWLVYKHSGREGNEPMEWGKPNVLKGAVALGALLTFGASASILQFSSETFIEAEMPVKGEEVAEGLYKFDFPFLADKVVWEKTINTFKDEHPERKVNYIYTGPSELNSKKKTHVLVYVFTEAQNEEGF